MPESNESFRLEITSHPQYLAVVRATMAAAAKAMDFSQEEGDRLAMVVDEAVSNVIRHGYHGRPGGPIHLSVQRTQRDGRPGVQIVLEDESQGVDLQRIEGRPLDDVRPGGLGVHIIRQTMDEVEYSHRPEGGGVRLRMCKYNQPDQPDADPTR